jgi:hypothetical protein
MKISINMRRFIKVTLIILATSISFVACLDNDDNITPSGNYSPIRGGFPQGDSELDDIIYQIKQDYGVYLLYKDIREEDINRTWVSAGTGNIIVAGDEAERNSISWSLPENQLEYYVNFFNDYIFPNITEDFAKKTFPVKIYMINNLREEARDYGEEKEGEEPEGGNEGTGVGPKMIHFGDFDNWVISLPEELINNEDETIDADNILRRLRCRFMIEVIQNSIERNELVIPDEFWSRYEMSKSKTCDTDNKHENCSMVDVADKHNPKNGLYTLGYVDLMEEKFGTEQSSKEIFKETNIFDGKPAHAQNWNSPSNPTWNLFEAYIMNAMWFTEKEFNEHYNTKKYRLIKEQYDFVVKYIYDTYGIDLKGIANGKKKE